MSTPDDAAYPTLSPLMLGGIVMTQRSSIREIGLRSDAAAMTGADIAILVNSQSITSSYPVLHL